MPENDSESANPAMDAEDWQIVFRVYAEYPILAFILAQHFKHLKELIDHGHGVQAVTGLDRAIESLMPHTNYRDAGHTVYRLAVAGNLKPDDEETTREIGIAR